MADTKIGMRVEVDMPGNKHDRAKGEVVRKPSNLLSEVRLDGGPKHLFPNARLKEKK